MSNGNASKTHTAQWERQSTWLAHLRNHKQEFQSSGIQGFALLEAMATCSINHKLMATKDKCERCWHMNKYCICTELNKLILCSQGNPKMDVRICILMHHKEYMSAGNSAKLLLQMMAYSTELYIFGKEGDVDRLHHDINADNVTPIILWPGRDAISTTDILKQVRESTTSRNKEGSINIHAIVLDGTYNQARNMYKSLKKKWGSTIPTAVALRPMTESVFHRSQKNYGKAHLQNSDDAVLRVSTAEACGVLLYEMGIGGDDVLEKVTKAVRLNNDALKYSRHHLNDDR